MGEDGTEWDRSVDEREAALAAREAALAEREAALAERMESARDILAAGEQRDAIADARDTGAEKREHHLDRARFLARTGHDYGDDLPERRGAAADRVHSKGDRGASHDDRIALTETKDEREADPTEADRP